MLVLYIISFHRHREAQTYITLCQAEEVRNQNLNIYKDKHKIIFVAIPRIKMCFNNPIWDGLDTHSESTHIMML